MDKKFLRLLIFAALASTFSTESVKAATTESDACFAQCEDKYSQEREASGFQRNPGEPLGLAFKRHAANNPAFIAAVEKYNECKERCNNKSVNY
jgi:hypothetical protein